MSKFVLALSLTSVLFVSCGKKSNELEKAVAISALEKKSFFRIDHEQDGSLLRSKLLNSLVEEKFPSGKKDLQVAPRDELDSFYTSPNDLADYEEKEKTMAKIIVSFSDRLEIYFLPENVLLKDVSEILRIAPESEKVFKWFKKADAIKTNRGDTYYLLSVNMTDIMKNDEKFFQTTISLNPNAPKASIPYAFGRVIELTITHQALIQRWQLQEETVRTTSIQCKVMRIAPADCLPCKYKRMVAASGYESRNIKNLDELRFSLKINERVSTLSQLAPTILNSKEFKTVERVAAPMSGPYEIELLPVQVVSFTHNAPGFEFTGSCINKNFPGTMPLAETADVKMRVTVYGRGAELAEKIKL